MHQISALIWQYKNPNIKKYEEAQNWSYDTIMGSNEKNKVYKNGNTKGTHIDQYRLKK